MSDHDDLLADDIGDQSLADYNLGNDEEEQLLADDYEVHSQNVPSSVSSYGEPIDMNPNDYSNHDVIYHSQPIIHQLPREPECVVPNLTVEVTNPIPPHAMTYAPYEPGHGVVPPAIPALPVESPQIVPSDGAPCMDETECGARSRFMSERPPGMRTPQLRDIPDSLDKVVVAGGYPGRGRHWQPGYRQRFNNPYRRNNVHRGNFSHRPTFPPPQRPEFRPDLADANHVRPVMEDRPMIPNMPPQRQFRPHMERPMAHMERPMAHMERPVAHMERPMAHMERPMTPQLRPPMELNQFRPQYQYRPTMERPAFQHNVRPNFEPRPMIFARPGFRPFAPVREVCPNQSQLPQVTVRFPPPAGPSPLEPEVRMLPLLPPVLPPGKKVLINPHFKGNFQPPTDGVVPAYIPTRIQKSPPHTPAPDSTFGHVKDIDDAAERFIAEQRNALARAATRKFQRRSPQRYIENTRIEIANDLAGSSPRDDERERRQDAGHSRDDDLLRRQEEFISANRAQLTRRMRSPSPPPRSPPRRSPSPRRLSPDRPRVRVDSRPHGPDEDSEYRRRMREQQSLRERVLRAKEVRRRKNAVASKQGEKERLEKERDREVEKDRERDMEKEREREKEKEIEVQPKKVEAVVAHVRPDTTRTSPERTADRAQRERSPLRHDEAEVNSTCENLTPPREELPKSPERDLTPPLPVKEKEKEDRKRERELDSDDELHLILDDIDDILSDDDDTGRFKEKAKKPEPPKSQPKADLRAKLASKDAKPPRQKIVFEKERDREHKEKERDRKRKDKNAAVSSSTKVDDSLITKSKIKEKEKIESSKESKSRPRIIFDKKEQKQKETPKKEEPKQQVFANRRVILQRKMTQPKEKSVFTRIEGNSDPTKPHPGIFSRAVRTAIGSGADKSSRIVVKKDEKETDIPIEYDSESSIDEDKLLEEDVGTQAMVSNLPHGMTDTRLKTLAGDHVQSMSLDKEDRSAKITFKTTIAAESFKKKFNNKMVAASRLTVILR